MMDKYFWVIGGGVLQLSVIKEARDLGYKIIVSDRSLNCFCRDLADIFLPIDIFDIDAHIKKAIHLSNEYIHIDGVLAAAIDASVTNSALNEALGLNNCGASVEVATVIHEKHKFRSAMALMGHEVPEFRMIADDSGFEVADYYSMFHSMALMGPVIFKNTDNSAGRGNTVLQHGATPKQFGDAIVKAIGASKSKVCLMEQMWVGHECTVETLFGSDGTFHPCFITDRYFETMNGNRVEVGLRHPSSLSPWVQRKMFQYAEQVARDFGIEHGAAKYDMILTNKGPRIIEMTTRLSGGFDCTHLVPAATGKNIVKAAVLTALGQNVPDELFEDTKHRVAISESMWFEPGEKIRDIDDVKAKNIPGVEHIFWRSTIGDTIQPYVDSASRTNFIITSGNTESEARDTMRKAKKAIRVDFE
jgi:biotin carboxylase